MKNTESKTAFDEFDQWKRKTIDKMTVEEFYSIPNLRKEIIGEVENVLGQLGEKSNTADGMLNKTAITNIKEGIFHLVLILQQMNISPAEFFEKVEFTVKWYNVCDLYGVKNPYRDHYENKGKGEAEECQK